MRLVLDTNVLVSALLHPDRTPAQALARLKARQATVLVDDRIAAEYVAVLARPKLRIEAARAEALLASLLDGAEVVVAAPLALSMTDADDRIFVEVARSGRADAIVTGNAKHFPPAVGVAVLSPAALLGALG